MIKLLFLLPIVMCTTWWYYLTNHGYTFKSGIKGYIYILIFNAVIILFFVLMIWITH